MAEWNGFGLFLDVDGDARLGRFGKMYRMRCNAPCNRSIGWHHGLRCMRMGVWGDDDDEAKKRKLYHPYDRQNVIDSDTSDMPV